MHRQARYFIRTALVCLLAASSVGALVLLDQGLSIDSRIAALLPVFYHLLMVGWVTQLICGVALWMFPPLSREQPRGDTRLGWFAYAALNGGLLLRAIFEPLHAWMPLPWLGWPLAASAFLQMLAIWPRVKARPEKREPKP
jgi:hypothetical protein